MDPDKIAAMLAAVGGQNPHPMPLENTLNFGAKAGNPEILRTMMDRLPSAPQPLPDVSGMIVNQGPQPFTTGGSGMDFLNQPVEEDAAKQHYMRMMMGR